MGDLIGFEGFLNASTPFYPGEHNALWKSDRRYTDFSLGNNKLSHCDYPRFYGDDGMQVLNLSTELLGCRDSDFDQYGDVAAFGLYPEWCVFTSGLFLLSIPYRGSHDTNRKAISRLSRTASHPINMYADGGN